MKSDHKLWIFEARVRWNIGPYHPMPDRAMRRTRSNRLAKFSRVIKIDRSAS